MSVINRMLRDLDRRHALPDTASADPAVRVVPRARRSDVFWISLALAAAVGLGWGSWVIYQMQPRLLATPLALSRSPVPPPATAPPPIAAAPKSPAPATAAAEPAPVAPELFKLAETIQTPIPPAPAPARRQSPKPTKLPPDQAIAPPAVAVKSVAGEVRKRDRALSSAEAAEIHFQKGVGRLQDGRPGAAAQEFTAALAIEPTHQASRQALVALRIEQSELDSAEQLLTEGMALSPANAQFATVLARIRVERGDYEGAADLLLRTNDAGVMDAEHQFLLATVLQRLGRDKEAVGAFENAARLAEPGAAGWVAMAMSYENVGRRAEALRAYRQSLVADASPALRSYAESRIRALK